MGAVFGLFAAFYHWVGSIAGLKYSTQLANTHFWVTFVGVNITFFPMHFLGLAGMPRRIPDYPDIYWYWNFISSLGSLISFFGMFIFFKLLFNMFFNDKTYLKYNDYICEYQNYKFNFHFNKYSPIDSYMVHWIKYNYFYSTKNKITPLRIERFIYQTFLLKIYLIWSYFFFLFNSSLINFFIKFSRGFSLPFAYASIYEDINLKAFFDEVFIFEISNALFNNNINNSIFFNILNKLSKNDKISSLK